MCACLQREGREAGWPAKKTKNTKKQKKDNLEDQKRCVLIVKWFLIVNPKRQKKPTWEQGKLVFS